MQMFASFDIVQSFGGREFNQTTQALRNESFKPTFSPHAEEHQWLELFSLLVGLASLAHTSPGNF
jgi:hypothetical protein